MGDAKRVVILGRSSSGKTSVINCLRDLGYQVGHEIATIVLDSRKTREVDKTEWGKRQKLMYTLQRTLEDSFEGLVFQDRSILDNYIYTKLLLGEVPDYFEDPSILAKKYNSVFELEKLPFKKTNTRIESGEKEAQYIYDNIRDFYVQHGFNPVLVPTFDEETVEKSVRKRTDYILSNFEDSKSPKSSPFGQLE